VEPRLPRFCAKSNQAVASAELVNAACAIEAHYAHDVKSGRFDDHQVQATPLDSTGAEPSSDQAVGDLKIASMTTWQ
jgi:hypothetical protein